MSCPSDPIEITSDGDDESPQARRVRESQERLGARSERAPKIDTESSAKLLARPQSAGNPEVGFTLGKARVYHTTRQNTPVSTGLSFSFGPKNVVWDSDSRNVKSDTVAASVFSARVEAYERPEVTPQVLTCTSADGDNSGDLPGRSPFLEHQR
jgi:hypothetical protein